MPSPIPFRPEGSVPEESTARGFGGIVKAFGPDAAERALRAGFPCWSYTPRRVPAARISLAGFSNAARMRMRTFENRIRILLEVTRSARAAGRPLAAVRWHLGTTGARRWTSTSGRAVAAPRA